MDRRVSAREKSMESARLSRAQPLPGYGDRIFDVQVAGRLALAAADAFALATGVACSAGFLLLGNFRHGSREIELARAAGVRTRVHEVRARRRMQHDGLRRRRLRGLIVECEVEANRGE